MANRNRGIMGGGPRGPPPPQTHIMRGPHPPQGIIVRGPAPPGAQVLVQAPPVVGAPQVVLHQQQQQQQHLEVNQLIAENQRLAATHVALRQELAAAQGEIQRLKQMLGSAQAEKEQAMRGLLEKNAKMEADLRAVEPIRGELHATRMELQAATRQRADLEQMRTAHVGQIQQMTADMQRMRADLQQIPQLRQEIDGLQQELARARQGVEFEQKANQDLVEQKAGLEKNLVSMAREVESLKAQLTNAQKSQGPAGSFVVSYPPPHHADASFPPAYASPGFGDPYGQQDAAAQAASGLPSSSILASYPPPHRNQLVGYAAPDQQQPQQQQQSVVLISGHPQLQGSYFSPDMSAAAPGGSTGVHVAVPLASAAAPAEQRVVVAGGEVAAAATAAADGGVQWAEHLSPDGRPFYYNASTGVSQWEAPAASFVRSHAGQATVVVVAATGGQQEGAGRGGLESGGVGGMGQRPADGQGGGHGGQFGNSSTAQAAAASEAAPAVLHVAGLPEDYSDNNLANLFRPYGRVVRVAKERNRTYGFVTMDSPRSADTAIAALNGMSIGSNKIRVERRQEAGGSNEESAKREGGSSHAGQQQRRREGQGSPGAGGGGGGGRDGAGPSRFRHEPRGGYRPY